MKYLLPCTRCGAKLEVDTTQAGEHLSCACGTALEIPSLRGIRALEPALATSAAPAQRRPWSIGRGWMFVGGLLLAIAGAVYGALHVTALLSLPEPRPREDRLTQIVQEVDQLTPADVHRRWFELRSEGLGPYQPPEHVVRRLIADQYKFVALVSLLVALGGVVLVGLAWLLPAAPRRAATRRPTRST